MSEKRERSGSVMDRKVGLRDVAWLIGLILALGMLYQQVLDTTARQQKYIDRRNEQHAEMQREINRLRDEAVERRVWLATKIGEVVP